MTVNNDQFYTRLPVNHIPLSELLTEEHLFYRIPEDWHVIITDIKGSTAVVQKGLHETVNLVATGSIVAVLNISFKANITVPFFFGGDGATFIVPPAIKEAAIKALLLYKNNTQESFAMDLRIGTVPVSEIYAAGHTLRVTKFTSSGNFHIPVILGDGLHYAERQIKGEDYMLSGDLPAGEEIDLSGMQCRWDRIKPPEHHYEVVSLIVVATAAEKQAKVFQQVITHIDRIYGTPDKRQPISITQLRLKSTFAKLGLELRAKFGRKGMFHLLQTWLTNILGQLYFRTRPGRTYLTRLIEMSDTLVIDGKINTVITGTEVQRRQLVLELNKLEAAGEIYYAFYVSRESVMSCYVRDYKDEHIHFVDGAEGGYTHAAGVLKLKIVHFSS